MEQKTNPSSQVVTASQPQPPSGYLMPVLLSLLVPPVGLALFIRNLNRSLKLKKGIFNLLTLVILLFTLLGSAGYVALYDNFQNHSANTYKIPNKGAGTGVSFNLPDGFLKNTAESRQASFSKTQNGLLTGGIYSSATNTQDTPYSPKLLAAINKELNNHPLKDETYSHWLDTLKTFLEARLPKDYVVNMGQSAAFTNPNIKSNAWLYKFSAEKSRSGSNNSSPTYQGELVYALGKQTAYYFALSTSPSEWVNSQPAWQWIFNSLKIDQ